MLSGMFGNVRVLYATSDTFVLADCASPSAVSGHEDNFACNAVIAPSVKNVGLA